MKLWAGRFEADLADAALRFSESLSVAPRMLAEDIWGSQAHAIMLGCCGIIGDDDVRAILKGLSHIARDCEAGTFTLRQDLEDVHMNVESRLSELVGEEAGGRLHTARSRNDQVLV